MMKNYMYKKGQDYSQTVKIIRNIENLNKTKALYFFLIN